jgi:Fur family ferric uptake transcriptional regulator
MQQEKTTFERYVRHRGLRMTPARRAVLEEIFSHHEHIDADRLHEAMARKGLAVSRATVYRNLDLLADCGLVRKYRLDRHRVLYEHIHAGMEHDHIVCRECGRVVEYLNTELRELQEEICRAHGFDPEDLTVQVVGCCLPCKRARQARAAGARSG